VSGTIGVISGELARFSDFSIALLHLQKPVGTRLVWAKGADVTGNCNTLVRGMVGDWLWILGDDHVFDPGLLVRLLAHDVDVVVPLCMKRTAPYDPVVYSGETEDGHHVVADLPESGLVPIHAAGNAGMLIRRHVIEALEEPVFESNRGQNEDLTFCRKAREAGFGIFCDVDAPLGHVGIVEVWPQRDEHGLSVRLGLGNGQDVTLRRLVREEAPLTG
jgi:hypothetical protein